MHKNTLYLVIASLFLFVGCGTKPQFPSHEFFVDSLSRAEQPFTGKTFFILPGNKDTSPNDPHFIEFVSYMNKALISRGFKLEKNIEKANMVIFLSYGIGDPKEHQYTYILPMLGQSGISSAIRMGTISSYGNFNTYSAKTSFTPTYGGRDDRSYPAANTMDDRFFMLEAYDLDGYRKDKKKIQLWRTTVTTTGTAESLRRVFPAMVTASIPFIGVNTDQKVKIALGGNNQNRSLQEWEQFLAGNWELLRPSLSGAGYKEGLNAGASMKLEKTLYDAGNWQELAWLVKDCNYGDNLQYYYLGRAAEGLHRYDAAEMYYNISNVASKSIITRCFGPGCSDYNFPDDVNARLKLIAELKASEKKQNNRETENTTKVLPQKQPDPEQVIKEIINSTKDSPDIKE